MSRVLNTETLFIDGPAGRLEAIYEHSAQHSPVGSVAVCHPHPQHGGTMQNKVTHTLARAFVRMGFAALRFNFRGTGKSEGEFDAGDGELDDMLAAIDWLQKTDAGSRLWVTGFSFGAAIAVKAAIATRADGLVSVAPPVRHFASGLASQPTCPWLIVQGDQDDIVAVGETIAWVNELQPGPEISIVSGGGHFFHGKLTGLREVVTEFVTAQLA
ncbi:MAG: alpha/beta hydrolase [Proteobacteria bacterium]|nr:alpha/beta hydrolase [Pseudomonadota bacterium]